MSKIVLPISNISCRRPAIEQEYDKIFQIMGQRDDNHIKDVGLNWQGLFSYLLILVHLAKNCKHLLDITIKIFLIAEIKCEKNHEECSRI